MPRALMFHSYGEPEDVLAIEEQPLREPGPREVRIKVKAFALNRADLLFIRGEHYSIPSFPSRLGDECSGIIGAVGEGVTELAVGDRVSTIPFHSDRYKTHGESTIVPAQFATTFPDRLSFEEGASIWMQYLTAYFPLKVICDIQAGDYVLIAAASSSAALGCMELARSLGAKTIGSTRTSAKKQRLINLGYDHVVAFQEESLGKSVMEFSQGTGAKMIYDPIGGKFFHEYSAGLARKATVIQYGMLENTNMEVDILPMVRTNSIVHPYSMYNHVVIPEQLKQGKQFIYEKLATSELKPRIDKVFCFEDAVASYQHMESGNQIGKIVVKLE